jgi:protein TonB
MLAYAASRPPVVDRRPHPNTLLFIIGAHVAVVAAMMSAKMDLPRRLKPEPPLIVDTIPDPPPPPPVSTTAKPHQPVTMPIDHTTLQPPVHPLLNPPVGHDQLTFDPGPIAGGGAAAIPLLPPTTTTPVKIGPRLLTPPSELKPPYPADKLLNEEEAAVTVRLTIDENGRVTAVDPVGRADREFLEAARRHLIAHWRFKPASEDGHAVASTTIVTLHFELES